MKVYKVNLTEYEKGWGSKVFDTLYFKKEEEALSYIKEYNAKNNLNRTPDYYTKAELITLVAQDGYEFEISEDTPVAVNFFGLRENFLHILEKKFDEFIHGGLTLTNEFLLPDILKNGINEGLFQIQSKVSESRWIGMTYKEDLESVKNHINSLIERGDYPDELWGN